MSDLGSKAALLTDIDAKVTTNGANENTGARVNQCLENIVDTLDGLKANNTITDFLLVYGAGTPGANGVYPYTADSNGKPSYQKGTGNGSHLVTWGAVSSQWTIGLVDLSPTYYYNSTDDVATPELATFTVTAGAGPVPSMVRFTGTVQAAIQALAALQGNIAGTKRYKVLLTQTGTDAPVVTVQRNGLSGIPVSSYQDVGIYRLTLSGAFPLAKTTAILQDNSDDASAPNVFSAKVHSSGDYITIVTGTGEDHFDDRLINTCLLVEVEP